MVNASNDETKQISTNIHFRGGVNMGIGSFNLVRVVGVFVPVQWALLENE